MARLNEGSAPGQRAGAPLSQSAPSTPKRAAEKGTSRPMVGGPPLEVKETPTYRKWNEGEFIPKKEVPSRG